MIISRLIEMNVNFAVCISINTFVNKGVSHNSRDYFLIIRKSRSCILKKLGFKELGNAEFKALMIRELKRGEIEEFKNLSDSVFRKVEHSKYGRVYELKSKSFKEHYHSRPVKKIIKPKKIKTK